MCVWVCPGRAVRPGGRGVGERWDTRDSEGKIGASTGTGPIRMDRRESENPRGETRLWNIRMVGDPKFRKDSGASRRNVWVQIVSCEKGGRTDT